jgi:hypothetical protein
MFVAIFWPLILFFENVFLPIFEPILKLLQAPLDFAESLIDGRFLTEWLLANVDAAILERFVGFLRNFS